MTIPASQKFDWMVLITDLEGGGEKGWRPSIHMPRCASRIQLKTINIRVQGLQDISRGDVMPEGALFQTSTTKK